MCYSIALVEDDPATRFGLQLVIERADMRVHAFAAGRPAAAAIQSAAYDAVVCDLQLPDISGIDVIGVAAQRMPRPALIVLTGYSTIGSAVAALKLGADNYLMKPCPPVVLLADLRAALQRRAAAMREEQASTALIGRLSQHVAQLQGHIDAIGGLPLMADRVRGRDAAGGLVVGALAIGPASGDVFFRQRRVVLSPIEYAVLNVLAATDGDVRFDVLARHACGPLVSPGAAGALVSVTVESLREKIATDAIVAIHQIAYRLNPAALR